MEVIVVGFRSIVWGFLKTFPLCLVTDLLFDYTMKRNSMEQEKKYALFYKGMILAIIFILSLTINSIYNADLEWGGGIYNFNFFSNTFTKLKEIIDFDKSACIEVYGCILLFIPFGFFASYFLWNKSKRIQKLVIYSCVFSILIQIIQIVFGRGSNIENIFFQVMGSLSGYFLFSYMNQVIYPLEIKCIKVAEKPIVGKIKWKHYCLLIMCLLVVRMVW